MAHPTAKFMGFAVGKELPITMVKKKLRATKRALKPFADVLCFLDSRGLHFRWHGRKGGLDFFSQPVDHRDKDRVLLVAFPEKQRSPYVAPAYPSPTGAWLGDVLSDLGLLV